VRTEPTISGGIPQEGDDFLELVLRLFDAGDIGEADFRVALDIDLGLGLADRHQSADPLLLGNAPNEEDPKCKEEGYGKDPRDDVAEERVLHRAVELHAMFREFAGDRRVDPIGGEILATILQRLLELTGDLLAAHLDSGDLAVVQVLLELRIGDWFHGLPVRIPALKHDQQANGDCEVPEIDLMLLVHVASLGSVSA
jgi:hypothetical protein